MTKNNKMRSSLYNEISNNFTNQVATTVLPSLLPEREK